MALQRGFCNPAVESFLPARGARSYADVLILEVRDFLQK
eukprot:CAMPEP_0204915410 /NCGR_PEP_ID=MMETSP1397-20131031/13414_1 /ASSEMBLY_ACC=CAM_ASM_000891 /TAXON_ID=49980 /ORGANISM="Climacostomum Climacostomum virens, Strain Stock W-24" /LENGTH=38 /DNA_ID= /DNA_START= /DNA_END= /DNA_ORIENTATION=